MEKYCYLNGKIIETKKAKVSITDIGLLRGFGVFDALKTYDGRPFLFAHHYKRIVNSAKMIGLHFPISQEQTEKIIRELVKKNKASDISVRIVLTGGESTDGTNYNAAKPTVYILMHKAEIFHPDLYRKGAKLITVEYGREVPKSKTNNYITKLKNDSLKHAKKAHELLYINNGNVLEGATCNIFIFKGNTLITPKDNILIGTRRELVLKIAHNQFKIEERDIKLKELLSADEVFITSCNRGIMPVTQIDNKKIGTGKVGINAQKLMAMYAEYVNCNK